MSVDRYTKTVLTIIAITLIGVNITLWEGRAVKPAYASETMMVRTNPGLPLVVRIDNWP